MRMSQQEVSVTCGFSLADLGPPGEAVLHVDWVSL